MASVPSKRRQLIKRLAMMPTQDTHRTKGFQNWIKLIHAISKAALKLCAPTLNFQLTVKLNHIQNCIKATCTETKLPAMRLTLKRHHIQIALKLWLRNDAYCETTLYPESFYTIAMCTETNFKKWRFTMKLNYIQSYIKSIRIATK